MDPGEVMSGSYLLREKKVELPDGWFYLNFMGSKILPKRMFV